MRRSKGFAYLLCWPRGREVGLACRRRFSFHEFYNFLPFNFLILIFFLENFFFLPKTFTHTHDSRPLPTTFSYTLQFGSKWDLRVLTSSAKSMNRELSFVVRTQFCCGHMKELAILVNRIFSTILAAWSWQQYPCRRVKLSFIVLNSQSDKKEEYFQAYFYRSILYPDGVR